MTIEYRIDTVLDREGGYVDNPADRGSDTQYSIAAAVARRGARGKTVLLKAKALQGERYVALAESRPSGETSLSDSTSNRIG